MKGILRLIHLRKVEFLSVFLLPVIWSFLFATIDPITNSMGYSLRVSSVLLVLAPVGAVLSATRAHRLATQFENIYFFARPRLVALSYSFGPPLIIAELTLLLAMAITSVTEIRQAPSFSVFLLTSLILTGTMVFGAYLGFRFRLVIAYPVSALIPFLILVIPISLGYYPIRHSAGYFPDLCCEVDSVLNTNSIRAGLLTWFLAIVSLLILLASKSNVTGALSSIPLIMGILIACNTSKDIGPDPRVPRAEPIYCQQLDFYLCSWPEHSKLRNQNQQIILEGVNQLSTAGFPKPHRLTESASFGPGIWNVWLGPGSHEEILRSLAINAVIAETGTCIESTHVEEQDTLFSIAVGIVTAEAGSISQITSMSRNEIATRIKDLRDHQCN